MGDLSSDAMLTGILLAVLGLVFGSFGSVLMARMPKDESIGGRSHCPHCDRTLRPIELIPLLSFAMQRGRCRGCGVKISWQYPLIEIVVMGMFLGAGAIESYNPLPSIVLSLVFWSMFMIGIIDARTQMIPDVLTAVLALCAAFYHLSTGNGIPWTGAMLGIIFFSVQWILSRGAWVGSGDILLAAALGLLLGSWQHVVVMLMAAYIFGALLVSVLLGLGHMKRAQHIAFGPFLIFGALIAFLCADKILMVMLPGY